MGGVKKPKPVSRCPVFLLRCPACNRNNFTQQEVDEGWMLLECRSCETIVKIEWVER
jgi:transcription elongation factor Elf1